MVEFLDRTHTNAEKFRAKKRLFGTEDLYPMWVADMDIASPRCINEALSKRLEHNLYGYEMISSSAIDAQVAWMKRIHNLSLEASKISISSSVVASIGCAIRAFSNVGDEVIIMEPVYSPFFSTVRENERVLISHKLTQDSDGVYRFNLDELSKQISTKTKILLLCSPHNPIGRLWSESEIIALASWCRDRDIIIISDEIHSDLIFTPHTPMIKHYSDKTIMLFGVGKTFNISGLAISSVYIADDEMRERFKAEGGKIHLAQGSLLSHIAFESAYRDGYDWYIEVLEHLRANRDYIAQRLANTPIKYTPPEATYLAWLDCRALGLGDRALRDFFAHNVGLGLNAGLGFGESGSGFMRLNFAVSREILEMAMDKITDAL